VNSLRYRLLAGVAMCLSVHFGQVQWDWMRSAMYGFSIIGMMYLSAEISARLFPQKGGG
jgi:type IV secretory pathway VirB2 component (pilin)